jgi:hypothetical protein
MASENECEPGRLKGVVAGVRRQNKTKLIQKKRHNSTDSKEVLLRIREVDSRYTTVRDM